MGNSTQISTIGRFACTYKSSIGIDVHAETLVCNYQRNDSVEQEIIQERAEFPTSKSGLQRFAQWCVEHRPEIILMESTGVLWHLPYDQLEDAGFTSKQLALVNARDVKGRKGHKTDKDDAQHLAELARLGSFRKSFVPDPIFRQARRISRSYISFKKDFAAQKNKYQKELNALGNRAGTVFSDIHGKAASIILEALISGAGQRELAQVVENNCGRLRATKEQILDCLRVCANHYDQRVLQLLRRQINTTESCAKQCLEDLERLLMPYEGIVKRLCTIPGVKKTSALLLLAEFGDDLSAFASVEKFCSWIGVCPGNKISAGKSYGSSPAKGNKYIRMVLTEIANGIALCKHGYLRSRFQIFKERRGRNRAIVAMAHLIARIIYHLLKTGEDYIENEANILKEFRLKKLARTVRESHLGQITVVNEDGVLTTLVST